MDAKRAMRVFPVSSRVVLSFCDRVAHDVVGINRDPETSFTADMRRLESTSSLYCRKLALHLKMSFSRPRQRPLFRLGNSSMWSWRWWEIISRPYLGQESRMSCMSCVEDVMADTDSFRMFETNMDEYLDEETEWVKLVMEGICKEWEQQVSRLRDEPDGSLGLRKLRRDQPQPVQPSLTPRTRTKSSGMCSRAFAMSFFYP